MGAENEEEQHKFDWEEFWSVLRYYYKYTSEEISNHSYPFLMAMYSQYPKRACENLGISNDKKDKMQVVGDDEEILPESEYPEELRQYQ